MSRKLTSSIIALLGFFWCLSLFASLTRPADDVWSVFYTSTFLSDFSNFFADIGDLFIGKLYGTWQLVLILLGLIYFLGWMFYSLRK